MPWEMNQDQDSNILRTDYSRWWCFNINESAAANGFTFIQTAQRQLIMSFRISVTDVKFSNIQFWKGEVWLKAVTANFIPCCRSRHQKISYDFLYFLLFESNFFHYMISTRPPYPLFLPHSREFKCYLTASGLILVSPDLNKWPH